MQASDGLCCGGDITAADSDDSNERPTATRNSTDLRRARQRARAVVEQMESEIEEFLLEQGTPLLATGRYTRLNEALTRIAGTTLRQDLVPWLESRRLKTMARAIRAAFDLMQQVLGVGRDDTVFVGVPAVSLADRALNEELTNIDAGLFYLSGDAVSQDVGDRVTRTLRQGFSLGERGQTLVDRVAAVLDAEADRQGTGISGMSTQSKAELIAHDSIQDAYLTAAQRRYLNNGFRYGAYDAVIDFKTSDMCRRLNEVCIDLVDHPALVPPNHPYCRSGIRPVLECPNPTTPDDVAQSYMTTIFRNAAYRPVVMNLESEYRPTALTRNAVDDESGQV